MSEPAKKLGILGGGQLGRMSALAAANLGIETVIFTPETNSPAAQIVRQTFVANYDDKAALKAFAKSVDAISYEFENIPVETIRYLKKLKPVYPDINVLEITQHRLSEKQFLNDCGIKTARWACAYSPGQVQPILDAWGVSSCILKTTRFGYDGKGQAKITPSSDIAKLWTALKSDEMIVEEVIDFKSEISAIIARDQFGKTAIYDPVLNHHTNHILSKTIAPAPLAETILKKAKAYAKKCADRLDLVGVLALELFVTKSGELLANELAPRPHNSGHWTINACAISQFENHIRTVCGLPVGSPRRHSDAIMLNLIGDDIALAQTYLNKANACIHLYGKNETRPGRKMGHINILKPLT